MTAALMMITYNRVELTKQTLESIFKTVDYPFHLIIVDNGSTDGTIEYLDSLDFSGLNYLKEVVVKINKSNLGIAIGRNIALLEADKLNVDWYCTIDNDVLLPEGWLSECIDIISKTPSFGAVGVNFESVQYPMVNLNGKIFQNKPQGNVGTACMVFPKSIHKMLGFFNHKEYSPLYGLEDSDFGCRLTLGLRMKIGYIKEPGQHLGDDTGDKSEYRQMKTKEHDRFVKKFQENCGLYYNRKKPVYVPFTEEDIPKK